MNKRDPFRIFMGIVIVAAGIAVMPRLGMVALFQIIAGAFVLTVGIVGQFWRKP